MTSMSKWGRGEGWVTRREAKPGKNPGEVPRGGDPASRSSALRVPEHTREHRRNIRWDLKATSHTSTIQLTAHPSTPAETLWVFTVINPTLPSFSDFAMPRVISGQSGSTRGEMEGKAIAQFSQATETPWGDEVGWHIPCDISESSVLKNPIDFPLPHPHPLQPKCHIGCCWR